MFARVVKSACCEHASRQNRDPGGIDVVQGLGHEAEEQADADAERDLLVARHRAEQRWLTV